MIAQAGESVYYWKNLCGLRTYTADSIAKSTSAHVPGLSDPPFVSLDYIFYFSCHSSTSASEMGYEPPS